MQLLETPPAFRPSPPDHLLNLWGEGIETAFDRYARQHADAIRTSWVYLPVFWTTKMWNAPLGPGHTFHADPELQAFLDTQLDPSQRYFTVSGADAQLERLPPNVTMFGSGGCGQVAIPMLPEPFGCPDTPRDLLASFMGHFRPGGPTDQQPHCTYATWDPDGIGTQVRLAMWKQFAGEPDFVLQEGDGNLEEDRLRFRELLCRAHYGLAPRGYGPTSMRLYHVLQQGAIPVYIYDHAWLPYQDVLDWSEFCVMCHWTELASLPERLRAESVQQREARRHRIAELVPDYFTLEGCCRQIRRYVEQGCC